MRSWQKTCEDSEELNCKEFNEELIYGTAGQKVSEINKVLIMDCRKLFPFLCQKEQERTKGQEAMEEPNQELGLQRKHSSCQILATMEAQKIRFNQHIIHGLHCTRQSPAIPLLRQNHYRAHYQKFHYKKSRQS